MKRSAALHIWRAIKSLRIAKKGAGAVFPELIQCDINGLQRLLLVADHGEHQHLLDNQSLRELVACDEAERAASMEEN